MGGDNLLSNPKSQPAALGLRREIWIKDGRQFFGRDARPVITHHQKHVFLQDGSVQLDAPITFHRLDGIDDHIHQRLRQSNGIGNQRRQGVVQPGYNLNLARGGFGTQQLANVGDGPGDFDAFEIER